MSQFWVYENYPNNKAVGHSEECPFFKKWGGNAPSTGHWYGPFDTRQQAIVAGQATKRPFHWCARC
jgi:hypothetical protein